MARTTIPSEVPFRDVRKLLESHGRTLSRISGSHHIFSKAGESPIVVPVHGKKVPPQYVRAINKRLGI